MAVVIGADPTVFLASQFVPGIDVDEFTIAGALRKAPVELVPCEMVNIEVPATSEIVLEGTLIIPAEVGDEGPYGEFCGYLVGTVIRGRLWNIQCVTMRRKSALSRILSLQRNQRRGGYQEPYNFGADL